MDFKRRDFLKSISSLGITCLLRPSLAFSKVHSSIPQKVLEGRRLILILLVITNFIGNLAVWINS